ncbi:hypothetical protein CYMTET_21518 [Cymbomonas tetramitiformis]|uniref:Uncharacterized protein n=1 Tax=Cymbomonas tetramitiformis TaxID=36881 RepID=A0AAE0L370_9CHLO|nr:hypothetical protein CYMTET_21518 [Cymbomonas tetramitiformis]|eukprot:gene3512-4417_t
MNSVWIGGEADTGLHERTPYWLNGFVPLAFLLRNANATELPATRGIYKYKASTGKYWYTKGYLPVGEDLAKRNETFESAEAYCNAQHECLGFTFHGNDSAPTAPVPVYFKKESEPVLSAGWNSYVKILAPKPVDALGQVHKYMDYILAHQNTTTGWLGPDDAEKALGNQYWPRSNMLLAMIAYAEAEPAVYDNVTKSMLLYTLEMKRRLETLPLGEWAAARWADLDLSVQWLIEHAPAGHAAELFDLSDTLHRQGTDWEAWFQTLKGGWPHNVNIAMALKSAAVLYRTTINSTLRELSLGRMRNLDRAYGLPTGMFLGDEYLPTPPTRSPSRGIELCGVVEAMFSYSTMFAVFGDTAFADRVERVAYNAFPATWASPRGGDMWAHQYLQAVNEINALSNADPHVWQRDGAAAEMYGLEPNFGCCTANFNQGWPKLANSLIYTAADGGVVVGVYAPVEVSLPNGQGYVSVETSYPFSDTATVRVKAAAALTLYLRIPGWAEEATVDGAPARNGTMHEVACPKGATAVRVDFNPGVRLEMWDNGTVSVHRGALLFSLPLGLNFTTTAHHFGDMAMSNDYQVTPTTPWNYALDVDPAKPHASLEYHFRGYQSGAAPFNHTNWACFITATVRQVPYWKERMNSAASPPESPACVRNGKDVCGPPIQVQLVPHGGTDLRIGEFPVAGTLSSEPLMLGRKGNKNQKTSPT